MAIVSKSSILISKHSRRHKSVFLIFVVAVLVAAFASQFLVKSTHADSINTTDFVTTWRVGADDTTVTISPWSNCKVDWNNDGVPDETVGSGAITHDFGSPGEYTIRISGELTRLSIDDNSEEKLIDINQWGTARWQFIEQAFAGTSLGEISALDTPDLSQVTYMNGMFAGATNFNSDLSDWDVSNVTSMDNMFAGATSFNGNISTWNVSNVTSMNSMFRDATSFNGDISTWNVSSVDSMSQMFDGATAFNGDISDWDTSSLTFPSYMFHNAGSFNRDLSNWDVTKVTTMYKMLSGSNLSVDNYDKTLAGWASQNVQQNIDLYADGLTYCDSAARNKLKQVYGWYMYGDIDGCKSPGVTSVGGKSIVYIREKVDAGQDIGLLSEDNHVDDVEYSIGCEDTNANNNGYFTIDQQNHLRSLVELEYQKGESNDYTVCIRAAKDYSEGGVRFSETMITIKVVGRSSISDVNFGTDNDRRIMTVAGSNFRSDMLDDNDIITKALSEPLVYVNGEIVPLCTDNESGLTKDVYLQSGADPDLVSDGPGCYYFLSIDANTGQYDFHFTDDEVRIWLNDTFDTKAPGTVSINGSPEFAYNQPGGGDGDGGNPGSGDKITARVEGQALKKGEVEIISKRPTFSGKAPAFSHVKVTVHSDPVTCETTADANGNWSCTLPKNLEPGMHTAKIVVTTVGGEVITLDDYKVRVPSSTIDPSVITGKVTPKVPNAGLAAYKNTSSASASSSSLEGVCVVTIFVLSFFGLSALLLLRLNRKQS